MTSHPEHEVPPRPTGQQRWAVTRRRGMWSFILHRGILSAGILFATLMLLQHYFGLFGAPEWRGLVAEIGLFILHALVFGFFMGWFFWHLSERRFASKVLMDDEDAHNTPTA